MTQAMHATAEPRGATRRLGATPNADGSCSFLVWAPEHKALHLETQRSVLPMHPVGDGYYACVADPCPPGTRYRFRLPDGRSLPDPGSRLQPGGVHGPSEVVADGGVESAATGSAPRLEDTVLYEIHVGTFTEEGTFDAAADRLDDLVDLGITTMELMPVAESPGARNWGYDGAFPFAVQHTYGGPAGLRRFVDACHRRGLAVCLDVVYNHFGPEGCVLPAFGPYLTDRYHTPWGAAVNLDGRGSDEVRRYLIENACHWVRDHHVDMLRLDAVHAIVDPTPRPFLQELTEAVHQAGRETGRAALVVAESDSNDPRLVRPAGQGGLGLDAVWDDDFHHALHAALTGHRNAHYVDFGEASALPAALREAFVLTGQRSVYRGRRHGAPTDGLPARSFVVFSQNHDQVANGGNGRRLAALAGLEAAKLAAGMVLLSPYVPLLFMGEERGATTPFWYFTDHGGKDLRQAVRRGRAAEMRHHGWTDDAPDPQSTKAFLASRPLPWDRPGQDAGTARRMRDLYRRLLRLRRAAALRGGRDQAEAGRDGGTVRLRRWRPGGHGDAVLALFRVDGAAGEARLPDEGAWRLVLDSADVAWAGPGGTAPEHADPGSTVPLLGHAFVVYAQGDALAGVPSAPEDGP